MRVHMYMYEKKPKAYLSVYFTPISKTVHNIINLLIKKFM